MGEIDTKSIESVQIALSLFGEKCDQRKYRSSRGDEIEREKELEGYLKDLADYKVQLDAKDSANMQAILQLEHYQKTSDKLSKQLKNSEMERERYVDKYEKAKTRIDDLEFKMNEVADQISENVKTREQLYHVISQLKATQGEIISMETELAAARDSELQALTQAELMETAAYMEKEKIDELLRHVSELNEEIFMLKINATDAEKQKLVILSEKDFEIELAKAATVQTQEQLEYVRKQVESMQNLEIQLLNQSIYVDTLQSELTQASEQLSSSRIDISDAVNEINQLKSDLEIKGRKNTDQAVYIETLEMELNQLKLELENSNEEVDHLNCNFEVLKDELQDAKDQIDEISGRESEAQIEIALLKSELRGMSKTAAGEARVSSIRSGLYLPIHQLAAESEEAKKETQISKEGTNEEWEQTENPAIDIPHSRNSFGNAEVNKTGYFEEDDEEKTAENIFHITISLQEYESLIKKAEKADKFPSQFLEDPNEILVAESNNELETLKKELEAATTKIGYLRARAEQAVSRAELADQAKTALEDQLRKWRQKMQKRRVALAAHQEESVHRKYSPPPTYPKISTPYQPLGKILNMKF